MLKIGVKYLQTKKKGLIKYFPYTTHVGRQQNALTTYMEYYEGEASSLYDCVVQTNECQFAYYMIALHKLTNTSLPIT
jgi:hypothetical protein